MGSAELTTAARWETVLRQVVISVNVLLLVGAVFFAIQYSVYVFSPIVPLAVVFGLIIGTSALLTRRARTVMLVSAMIFGLTGLGILSALIFGSYGSFGQLVRWLLIAPAPLLLLAAVHCIMFFRKDLWLHQE